MEFLANNLKGLCSKCGELLGFIELKSRELFCYNCEDYIILPMSECLQYCNQELKNLRESFRELIVEGDAKRYLKSYLNILEKTFLSIESPRGIDIEQKIELLQLNQHFFITMTLAIKWILEDLNFKFKNNKKFSTDIASNILTQWYTLFQQKIFLENELGMFISKSRNAKPIFYYYQFFDFYQSTLNEFSTFHKDELNSENYEEKIAEFILILTDNLCNT